jgi:hypothetical protein
VKIKLSIGEEMRCVPIFKVITSRGFENKYDGRLIIADSITDAITMIIPFLEDNERITDVSKVHDANIWTIPGRNVK